MLAAISDKVDGTQATEGGARGDMDRKFSSRRKAAWLCHASPHHIGGCAVIFGPTLVTALKQVAAMLWLQARTLPEQLGHMSLGGMLKPLPPQRSHCCWNCCIMPGPR